MKGFLGKQYMFKFSDNQVLLTDNGIQGGAYIHTIGFYPHSYIKKSKSHQYCKQL